MSSLNLIGGEKGGVGKSVAARVLAQYFIDKGLPFTGFDTDRSHASFSRFYAGFASPVLVDSFESLDSIAAAFEETSDGVPGKSVIVDLAAQTEAPVARWMGESDVLAVLRELGVTVNYWHLTDAGKDSVDLLERLVDTYGAGPRYVVVRNLGRGSDFSLLAESPALKKVLSLNGTIIDLPQLQEASMRKIDRHSSSFWSAVNNREGPDTLGLLERQRVRIWLKTIYASLDNLSLA